MRQVVGAVARHPELWLEVMRALTALSPDGWWRRAPFIPRVEPAYAAWRMATAYGSKAAEPSGDDLVDYLTWRKQQRRLR